MNKDEKSSGAEAIACIVLSTQDAKMEILDKWSLRHYGLTYSRFVRWSSAGFKDFRSEITLLHLTSSKRATAQLNELRKKLRERGGIARMRAGFCTAREFANTYCSTRATLRPNAGLSLLVVGSEKDRDSVHTINYPLSRSNLRGGF